MRVLNSM